MDDQATVGPRLESWTLVRAGSVAGLALAGQIYGDQRFAPGHAVVTTRLVDIDLQEGQAFTRHTKYRLGQPSPTLLAWLEDTGQTLDELVSRMTTD